MSSKKRAPNWTVETVARTRRTVAELIAARGALGHDGKIRYAAGQVMLLREDPSDLQQLLRLGFALEALSLHATCGGLRPSHVSRLSSIAFGILEEHGIARGRSRLSFLYGEIYAHLASIAQAAGDAWRASLFQARALQDARESRAPDPGRLEAGMGRRALRAGFAREALYQFDRAEAAGHAPAMLLCDRVSAMRLAGLAAASVNLLHDAPSDKRSTWELLKSRAASTGDYRPIRGAIAKGRSHYEARFIAEGLLALHAAPNRLAAPLPPLGALLRRKGLSWQRPDCLVDLLAALEAIAEATASDEANVVRLGEELAKAGRLESIEHEALAWLAGARIFAGTSCLSLAALAFARYRAICLAASDGANDDCYALAADLAVKPWALGSVSRRAS